MSQTVQSRKKLFLSTLYKRRYDVATETIITPESKVITHEWKVIPVGDSYNKRLDN